MIETIVYWGSLLFLLFLLLSLVISFIVLVWVMIRDEIKNLSDDKK